MRSSIHVLYIVSMSKSEFAWNKQGMKRSRIINVEVFTIHQPPLHCFHIFFFSMSIKSIKVTTRASASCPEE